MTEALTSTLPAAPVVVEIMATSPAPSDESEAEIVGEISASDDILKKDTTTTAAAASMEEVNEYSETSAVVEEKESSEPQPKEDETLEEASSSVVVVDQEAVAVAEEKESAGTIPADPVVEILASDAPSEESVTETQPKEDEAPEEPSVVVADQQAVVAEEKESNETEPKEVEAPQEPVVMDQEPVEEPQLKAEEEANTEEQARLATAENIRKAEEQVATNNSSTLSFAKAFGGTTPDTPPPSTPGDSTTKKTPATPLTIDTIGSNSSDTAESSHSANSAAKNKKVSGLMNAYLDKVTVEPKPGDSVENWISASSSPRARQLEFSPTHSPSYLKLLEAKSLSVPCIDSNGEEETEEVVAKRRASIAAIRAKLDETAKKSPAAGFEFGEAFRQKQRFSQLSDKERAREAVTAIRGFDQVMYCGGRTASGEVDTSHIEKSFVFEGTAEELRLHNGSCLVDYKNTDFRSYVFLVHRTRGLMVLQCSQDSPGEKARYQVPGGPIEEDEFLRAAKRSAHSKFQLQIAAREGAARGLYRETGIDVRAKLERMKPAVLRMNPPEDKNGVSLLKNENDNRLYYFLQIDDEDTVPEKPDSAPLAAPEGEADSKLKLKLSSEYTTFTFAKEPKDAAEFLQEHSDGQSTTALQMVMNEAAGAGVEPPPQDAVKSPPQDALVGKNGENNKEFKKKAPAADSGSQVAGSTTVYKTVGEKESKTGKSVSRAMDPKILDDVDGKPKNVNGQPKVSNETADPPEAFCGCCVVM